ncbi:MAG: ABC transporter permease subunit [Candidatus Lokiarchaeota archaeon]|nr:ABC transporter permease subunit [Candidatus Lokiarchaeota archaeon]
MVENGIKIQGSKSFHYRRINKINFRSPAFIIGILILFILLNIAIFQDWLSLLTYEEAIVYSLDHFSPPSLDHPLGTSYRGLDVISRLIFGTRTTLVLVGTSNLIALFFGLIVGTLAGFYGGWIDIILMRIMDVILSFPGIILAILFLVIYGNKTTNIIIVFGIMGIPYIANIIRSCFLKQKELPYIDSAKIVGASKFRIIYKHILPNCIEQTVVAVSFNCCRTILNLSVLAFFRLGNPIGVDWSSDLVMAIGHVIDAPWAVFSPVLMIISCILAFLLIGDGLRDMYSLKESNF